MPSARYGSPLRLMWLLLGLIYLFPGLWKFVLAGSAWVFGDQLRDILFFMWFEQSGGWRATIVVDQHPLLYRAMAAAAITFELGFVCMVFTRWRRWLAVVGLGFHAGVYALMTIPFASLAACYLMLFDHSRWMTALSRRFRTWRSACWPVSHEPKNAGVAPYEAPLLFRTEERARAQWAVGLVLIGGNICMGCLGRDGWPFTVYPRFANSVLAPHVQKPLIVIHDEAGRETKVDHVSLREQLSATEMAALLAELRADVGIESRRRLLEVTLERWSASAVPLARALARACRITIRRAVYSTFPRDKGAAPIAVSDLGTFGVSPCGRTTETARE